MSDSSKAAERNTGIEFFKPGTRMRVETHWTIEVVKPGTGEVLLHPDGDPIRTHIAILRPGQNMQIQVGNQVVSLGCIDRISTLE